jgi:hypothetical protein
MCTVERKEEEMDVLHKEAVAQIARSIQRNPQTSHHLYETACHMERVEERIAILQDGIVLRIVGASPRHCEESVRAHEAGVVGNQHFRVVVEQ